MEKKSFLCLAESSGINSSKKAELPHMSTHKCIHGIFLHDVAFRYKAHMKIFCAKV